ncbi:hypothetical protein AK812_SmicGene26382 [Symbiodinium microadriaticum]|uniref:Uncharacterized protein n=1 Tax=Symbiodinium microadriaticum TaxID=2951 RepID=A0A1Q9D9K0_SYMMI|nr:hypothetical protein AK812_SmicGene26382 [Symbiodinium microadriaticum]CAE7337701.1 unnamed protein product [Symbiodinium microadriaticum]CAE7948022.1 unnamed protein product [Symbiodinium sp. KB8]
METMVLASHGIMRFHATRKLNWNVSGEVVPMMLELGIRTQEAHKLWEGFGRLSHSGATRVVATSLRADKMGRSALANTVQRLSEELSGPEAADLMGDGLQRICQWLCAQRPYLAFAPAGAAHYACGTAELPRFCTWALARMPAITEPSFMVMP